MVGIAFASSFIHPFARLLILLNSFFQFLVCVLIADFFFFFLIISYTYETKQQQQQKNDAHICIS